MSELRHIAITLTGDVWHIRESGQTSVCDRLLIDSPYDPLAIAQDSLCGTCRRRAARGKVAEAERELADLRQAALEAGA